MNPNLQKLHAYPFAKLRALFSESAPPQDLRQIALSIGEPQHTPPKSVINKLSSDLLNNPDIITKYPTALGVEELRITIQQWLIQRFHLSPTEIDPGKQIIPVNGTREALFSFVQAVIDSSQKNPLVLMPNPFYQIYEGAALLANANPYYLNCTEDNQFVPDYTAISEHVWKDCQLLFLCSPGNPTGTVTSLSHYQYLLEMAEKHDFIIASDECYSELYFDEANPPLGLLEACEKLGKHDFKRCVVFHSLSKRSNLPGLRSGFVAGDESIIQAYLKYRTYHGCSMPLHTQLASIEAWQDEEHVKENRELYRMKFKETLKILSPSLSVSQPDASFYLWPKLPCSDEVFAKKLYEEHNVIVLPGRYLAREAQYINPGNLRVRMALVATLEDCIEAATRIKHLIDTL